MSKSASSAITKIQGNKLNINLPIHFWEILERDTILFKAYKGSSETIHDIQISAQKKEVLQDVSCKLPGLQFFINRLISIYIDNHFPPADAAALVSNEIIAFKSALKSAGISDSESSEISAKAHQTICERIGKQYDSAIRLENGRRYALCESRKYDLQKEVHQKLKALHENDLRLKNTERTITHIFPDLAAHVTAILSDYCQKPQGKREEIYFFDVVEKINEAIRKKMRISYTFKGNRSYDNNIPYKYDLVPSDNRATLFIINNGHMYQNHISDITDLHLIKNSRFDPKSDECKSAAAFMQKRKEDFDFTLRLLTSKAAAHEVIDSSIAEEVPPSVTNTIFKVRIAISSIPGTTDQDRDKSGVKLIQDYSENRPLFICQYPCPNDPLKADCIFFITNPGDNPLGEISLYFEHFGARAQILECLNPKAQSMRYVSRRNVINFHRDALKAMNIDVSSFEPQTPEDQEMGTRFYPFME